VGQASQVGNLTAQKRYNIQKSKGKSQMIGKTPWGRPLVYRRAPILAQIEMPVLGQAYIITLGLILSTGQKESDSEGGGRDRPRPESDKKRNSWNKG